MMCTLGLKNWQQMEAVTVIGKQRGFSYLVVLMVAIALGIASMATYEQLDTVAKREREAEWWFVGQQYQQAIASYYRHSHAGQKTFPEDIESLLKDKRFVSVVRHLRKPYLDPINGQPWQLVLNDEQKIVGVVSSSAEPILQLAKLADFDKNADKIQFYSDIQFVASPSQQSSSVDADDFAESSEELRLSDHSEVPSENN
jgi:hypothetical protein